jgi:F-type H+-transporting ATPase subunit d
MSARSAVARIDWPKLATALSLTPATTSALTAFRKRNVDAHNKLNHLKASKTEVDFAYYRGLLKNTKVIDEIEKASKSFKPVTYDVTRVLKGIEAFEGEAVKSAQETEKKIAEQLKDMEETVKNIEQARHPEELSVQPPSMIFDSDGSWMICTRPFRICNRRLNEWCRLVSGWYASRTETIITRSLLGTERNLGI